MNVYSITEGQSSTGGATEPEVLKHANVPCLLEVASGGERQIVGREGVVVTHWIYADTDNAIVEKDVIKIGARVFDVQRVDDVQERGHHYEISVQERT